MILPDVERADIWGNVIKSGSFVVNPANTNNYMPASGNSVIRIYLPKRPSDPILASTGPSAYTANGLISWDPTFNRPMGRCPHRHWTTLAARMVTSYTMLLSENSRISTNGHRLPRRLCRTIGTDGIPPIPPPVLSPTSLPTGLTRPIRSIQTFGFPIANPGKSYPSLFGAMIAYAKAYGVPALGSHYKIQHDESHDRQYQSAHGGGASPPSVTATLFSSATTPG